jgi:hypothetical protein
VLPPVAFKATLQHHLDEIGWRQIDLVKHSQHFVSGKISRSQMSGWLGDGQARSLTRAQINKLAFILFDGYRQQNKASYDPTYLEVILSELLHGAGFSLQRSMPIELAWHRIRDKKALRVGYISVPQLVEKRQDSVLPEGPAVEFTHLITQLMGINVEWVQQANWTSLLDAIASRTIDVICPILVVLPARMWFLKYSRPITNHPCEFEVAGLVDRNQIKDNIRFRPVDTDRTIFEFDNEDITEEFLLTFVKDEASQNLAALFAPRGTIAGSASDIDEACKQILENPRTSQDNEITPRQIRCFLASRLVCHALAQKHRQLACIVRSKSIKPIKLPVAFAVHVDEARLMELINQSLGVFLDDKGFIRGSFLGSAEVSQSDPAGILQPALN